MIKRSFPNPLGRPCGNSPHSQPSTAPDSQAAIVLLHNAGLRVTDSRLGLLRIMMQHRGAYLKPEDVVRIWVKQDYQSSAATVYRVLAHLAETGLLRRGLAPDGKVVYTLPDSAQTRTIPMTLPDGRVIALADADLPSRIIEAARHAGVDVSTLAIRITGQELTRSENRS